MSRKPNRSKWRNPTLVVSVASLFLPLTGCSKLTSFVQGGGLTAVAPVVSALTSMTNGQQQPGATTSFASQTSPQVGGATVPSGFGPNATAPNGGLSLFDSLGGNQQAGNGVLNLPIMAQSSGGDEAAIRGCGPTSLLMATGHGNPSDIQGVLVETCERPGGLVADRAVAWLHANGYPGSQHFNNWTVDMLREETMVRRNPVLINFRNPNTGNGHIVVVTGVTDQGVHINDPGPGARRVLSVEQFTSQWADKDEYAIPVRRA